MKAFQESNELYVLKTAVLVYLFIFVLKIAIYFLTGVMALLAEALHTLNDIFISFFLLISAKWSYKSPDDIHMFGHGRLQYVASLVASTLFISFTSFKLYEEAIPLLFRHEERIYQNLMLALGVIILSMIIIFVPLIRLLRQKIKGPIIKAQLMELVNDEMGLIAALIGILFIIKGHNLADPLATIIVATIIVIKAIGLFRESISLLLGRSPEPKLLSKIEILARSVPGVINVHGLRAEYIGHEMIHADMHIIVKQGIPIEEAHRIAREVREKIHNDMKGHYCTIHVDPEG